MLLPKITASIGDVVGTGQGDNCRILDPSEFGQETLLLSYLRPEEVPYVILKSAREEFIFTDRAFISVKGHSSIGTKKCVDRYNYSAHKISNVRLRTPGLATTDLDGELRFYVGTQDYGIDIRKAEWEGIKPLYRSLLRLEEQQYHDTSVLKLFQEALPKALMQSNDAKTIKDLTFSMAIEAIDRFQPFSYKYIWDSHGK
eukprot:gene6205-6678_t